MAQQQTVLSSKPPSFYGKENEDCEAHWLKFEDFCEDANIQAANKITRFRSTLYADARNWYEVNKESFDTLDNLKKSFFDSYKPEIAEGDLTRKFYSISMESGESLFTYKNRVQLAAQKAKIESQVTMAAQFAAGLPDAIKSTVQAHCHATLSAAYKSASAIYKAPVANNAMAMPIMADDSHLNRQMGQLYVTRHPSRDRQPRNTFKNTRPVQNPNKSERTDRYSYGDDYASRRNSQERQGSRERPPSRSPSRGRSTSRGRDTYRRRRPTPGKFSRERQVSFEAQGRKPSRSPSAERCFFCKARGHLYADCRKLRAALKSGDLAPQDF